MRSRYDLMTFSEQRDSKDRFFPDVMSLPTHKFRFTEAPVESVLTSNDQIRFDITMYKQYQLVELDDIIRIINKKPLLEEASLGDKMVYPSKQNLEEFYTSNFT